MCRWRSWGSPRARISLSGREVSNGSAATCALAASHLPFLAGLRQEESDETILCVDEDSGLIVDEGEENVEKFFEADGSPSAISYTLKNVLRRIERDQIETDLAVSALAEAGVIKPWPLTAAAGNQQVRVNGLHQIDELALNALSDATFIKLRKASSLVIAHGQLLSVGQVSVLSRLSALHGRMEQPVRASPTEERN